VVACKSLTAKSGHETVKMIVRPVFSSNALKVLESRYLKKDEGNRVIENPEDMFRRVSRNIASIEKYHNPGADIGKIEDDFYSMMMNLDFLPNSPTLMNAGRDLQQLSACFVLPVEDSLESIFEAVKNSAIIHQSGGGTGFSFSNLRPADDRVSTTGGMASGPVSFMKVFNTTTDVIKQGGTRRGANMGTLRIDHPDIETFITVKDDLHALTNFNLSVAVTGEFMETLKREEKYALINPRTGKAVREVAAETVFDLAVESAWKSGEPGLIFLDRINRDNPTPQLGEIASTNPCGEQPLLPYESCNLGSINLGNFIKKEGKGVRGDPKLLIDWERLAEITRRAVHFLDNVIDANRYPLRETESVTKGNRKVGLGVMGLADMFIELRIPYGSETSFRLATDIMSFVNKKAWEESERLAQERGPFPNFKGSKFDKEGRRPVRNATTTTIAPTGTLSIIANCSSGIEPLFSISYTRNVLNGTEFSEVTPLFEKIAREEGFYHEELMKKVISGQSLNGLEEIPDEIKRVFVTAFDIPVRSQIKMQAAFQKYTDNAVSKTINFPESATREEAKEAFLAAYDLGCKGITIYRSGTRKGQVLKCMETLYC
jgi:ribonucleoside-diphosphate reductase alpha chain